MNDFYKKIEDLLLLKNKLKVLQIGGNDGQQSDFVNSISNNKNIELHILEPVPIYYAELKNFYQKHENVHTYNFAITNTTSVEYINFIPPHHSMPNWLKGCSSFFTDRNILSGYCEWDDNGNPSKKYDDDVVMSYINKNVVKLPVLGLSFHDFIKLSNIDVIDVLIIDTEGYEYDILKQINLDKFIISLIVLEFHNQTGENKKLIQDLLKSKNYNINYEKPNFDLLAYKF